MGRLIVLIAGLILAGLALVASLAGGGIGAVCGFGLPALLLVAGFCYERVRYKPLEPTRPGSGWQATAECFIDPDSQQRVRVYFNPATGERKYVAE